MKKQWKHSRTLAKLETEECVRRLSNTTTSKSPQHISKVSVKEISKYINTGSPVLVMIEEQKSKLENEMWNKRKRSFIRETRV